MRIVNVFVSKDPRICVHVDLTTTLGMYMPAFLNG